MRSALLAEMVILAPGLLAKWDPAQAQDPAGEAQNPEQDPLVDRLLMRDLGKALLAARVALDFERLHVPCWYAVGCHH